MIRIYVESKALWVEKVTQTQGLRVYKVDGGVTWKWDIKLLTGKSAGQFQRNVTYCGDKRVRGWLNDTWSSTPSVLLHLCLTANPSAPERKNEAAFYSRWADLGPRTRKLWKVWKRLERSEIREHAPRLWGHHSPHLLSGSTVRWLLESASKAAGRVPLSLRTTYMAVRAAEFRDTSQTKRWSLSYSWLESLEYSWVERKALNV